MKTAVVGAVFVDVKGFSQVQYVPTGTNIGSVRIVHGGVCRNVCETYGRQGQSAVFISMTDNTALGRDVRERLNELGVDTRHTLYAADGMGMWLAILDEHGELAGSVSKQPDFEPLETYIREQGSALLEDVDSVVLEIDMNERIALEVLTLAEAANKPAYAIVGNMGVILRHPDYLSHVKCFICNEIEAGRLFGQDLTRFTPEQMMRFLPDAARTANIRAMVVTMGPEGAVYFDDEADELGHCPADPATMVDSTGAGDAFFAGTVMALDRGMPLHDAVKVGSRLAAQTLMCENSCCEHIDNLFDL